MHRGAIYVSLLGYDFGIVNARASNRRQTLAALANCRFNIEGSKTHNKIVCWNEEEDMRTVTR